MSNKEAEVREFWLYLEATMPPVIKPEDEKWLPQIIANLIDDYRYLEPLILRDAEQNPELKALLDRADAVSAAIPITQQKQAAFVTMLRKQGREREAEAWIKHGFCPDEFMTNELLPEVLPRLMRYF